MIGHFFWYLELLRGTRSPRVLLEIALPGFRNVYIDSPAVVHLQHEWGHFGLISMQKNLNLFLFQVSLCCKRRLYPTVHRLYGKKSIILSCELDKGIAF